MEQILEARSDEEAAKLLQECGYGELTSDRPEELDRVLAASREAMLAEIQRALDGQTELKPEGWRAL